jgi:hypothetical protein
VKIKKLFAGIFLGAILTPFFQISADLDPTVRERLFPWESFAGEKHAGLVRELCGNKNSYSLDETLEIVSARYHAGMSCFFDEAMRTAVAQTDENVIAFSSSEKQENVRAELQKIRGANFENSENCTIVLPKKPVDFCADQPNYSACMISEIALREWCGYQQFLSAKSRDTVSFSHENPTGNRAELLSDFEIWQRAFDREQKKSAESLAVMLSFYTNFLEQYQLHAWSVGLRMELNDSQTHFQSFLQDFDQFSAKFINASK